MDLWPCFAASGECHAGQPPMRMATPLHFVCWFRRQCMLQHPKGLLFDKSRQLSQALWSEYPVPRRALTLRCVHLREPTKATPLHVGPAAGVGAGLGASLGGKRRYREAARQRDRKTEGQRDREAERQRDRKKKWVPSGNAQDGPGGALRGPSDPKRGETRNPLL